MTSETPAEVLAEMLASAKEENHLSYSETARFADRLSRSLAAGREAPDGYVLMPRKMTIEMSIAFAVVWFSRRRAIDDDDMQDAYDALIESAPPAEPAKASEPEYGRDMIADMLTDYANLGPRFTRAAIREQIRLLRAADNADAANVRTVRASGSAPDELAKIGELIRTQDNRITDQPIFIVQQRRRIYGLDDGYCENFVWIDGENSYTDEERAERDAERVEEGLPPAEYRQCGYIDIWEFVTACFTEQGSKDYLRLDGHNLREPRIYAAGSYRNAEFRAVRSFLMSLGTATPPASAPEVTGYQLSLSEANRLIDAHDEWIAEADSIGADWSGNAAKLEKLHALTSALQEKNHD